MMKQNSSIYYIKASWETLILSERNSQAAKPLICSIIGHMINPCKAQILQATNIPKGVENKGGGHLEYFPLYC